LVPTGKKSHTPRIHTPRTPGPVATRMQSNSGLAADFLSLCLVLAALSSRELGAGFPVCRRQPVVVVGVDPLPWIDGSFQGSAQLRVVKQACSLTSPLPRSGPSALLCDTQKNRTFVLSSEEARRLLRSSSQAPSMQAGPPVSPQTRLCRLLIRPPSASWTDSCARDRSGPANEQPLLLLAAGQTVTASRAWKAGRKWFSCVCVAVVNIPPLVVVAVVREPYEKTWARSRTASG
jgi:hypothetical protein